jgi:hypothetical protein
LTKHQKEKKRKEKWQASKVRSLDKSGSLADEYKLVRI